jgi:hypothetical protein
MNPMLATTWAAFGVGEQFEFPSHGVCHLCGWNRVWNYIAYWSFEEEESH